MMNKIGLGELERRLDGRLNVRLEEFEKRINALAARDILSRPKKLRVMPVSEEEDLALAELAARVVPFLEENADYQLLVRVETLTGEEAKSLQRQIDELRK